MRLPHPARLPGTASSPHPGAPGLPHPNVVQSSVPHLNTYPQDLSPLLRTRCYLGGREGRQGNHALANGGGTHLADKQGTERSDAPVK